MNAEAVKTKEEQENEVKRWTTFLQKPDRPIPKSKADLELERKAATRYRVKICKQPKPRCAPNRTPSPEFVAASPEPIRREIVEEDGPVADATVVDECNVELTPGSEPQYVEYWSEPEIIVVDTDAAAADVGVEVATEEAGMLSVNENVAAEEVAVKSEEEQLIERQLADVQRQLLALSTLPLTIQATLDAVTKQLADLVPALNKQQQIGSVVETAQQINGTVNGCIAEGRQ